MAVRAKTAIENVSMTQSTRENQTRDQETPLWIILSVTLSKTVLEANADLLLHSCQPTLSPRRGTA